MPRHEIVAADVKGEAITKLRYKIFEEELIDRSLEIVIGMITDHGWSFFVGDADVVAYPKDNPKYIRTEKDGKKTNNLDELPSLTEHDIK